MEGIATGLMRLAGVWLVVATLVGLGCQAEGVEANEVINQLDAPDPVVRAEAIRYWLDGDDSNPSRLAQHRELWSAIDERSDEFQPDTLRELYRHLTDRPSSPAYEVSALMPLTYQRMLRTALADASSIERERQRIMQMIVPSKDGGVNRNGRYGLLWDVAGGAERTAVWETHRTVFEALANDPEVEHCEAYVHAAYVVMGSDTADLLDILLDAESERVRQIAWLLWGLLDMPSDRTPEWESEPEAIAMCMVAAETLRSGNPDMRIEQLRRDDAGGIELGPFELDDAHRKQLRNLLLQADYAAAMAKHRREYLIETYSRFESNRVR
ncbi:MAG: hypothetical protein ACIAQF_11265 [Phycisphaerales bacterium JB065]